MVYMCVTAVTFFEQIKSCAVRFLYASHPVTCCLPFRFQTSPRNKESTYNCRFTICCLERQSGNIYERYECSKGWAKWVTPARFGQPTFSCLKLPFIKAVFFRWEWVILPACHVFLNILRIKLVVNLSNLIVATAFCLLKRGWKFAAVNRSCLYFVKKPYNWSLLPFQVKWAPWRRQTCGEGVYDRTTPKLRWSSIDIIELFLALVVRWSCIGRICRFLLFEDFWLSNIGAYRG